MEMIKVKAVTDRDGILKLEVPTGLLEHEVEVVLVVQPTDAGAVDDNGWPIGFFDRTYGVLADDPIERPPQLPLEQRDPIK
jgi:hypothetical protein